MAGFDLQDTFQKVQATIAEKLNIEASTITKEATLQDLGADSLDMVEIIMKMEDQFGIQVNDEDAERLCDVNDVVEYVHKLRTK